MWDAQEGLWTIIVRNLETDEVNVQKAKFVITSIGRFNAWKLPDYPGISEYKELLRHASNCNDSFDPKDKMVAVIGNGASGI